MRKIKRCFRHWWQRRTRGFDDSELWSLDDTIINFIEPRLRAFIDDMSMSHPMGLDEKEWKEKLEKMHYAFHTLKDDGAWSIKAENSERINEGLDLFRKYFLSLWD